MLTAVAHATEDLIWALSDGDHGRSADLLELVIERLSVAMHTDRRHGKALERKRKGTKPH